MPNFGIEGLGITQYQVALHIYLKDNLMNTVFFTLRNICEPILRRKSTDFEKFSADLKVEAEQTQIKITQHILSITNSTQLKAFFNFSMQELSKICDELFEFFDHDPANSNILILLDIMAELRQTYPTYVDADTKFPKAFRKIYGQRFTLEWNRISLSWKDLDINQKAIKAASYPFLHFETGFEEMTWYHFTWMNRYVQYLRTLEFGNSYGLKYGIAELLIRMDFNIPAFTGYCTNLLKEFLDGFADRQEQLYMMDQAKKTIMQLSLLSKEPFYPFAASCQQHLMVWFEKEEGFRAKYASEFSSSGIHENKYKFQFTGWTSRQISYFFKQLVDEGIIKVDKLDDLAHQISYNCRAANNTDFLPSTAAAKLYFRTEEDLAPIIEYLDHGFDTMKPTYELVSKLIETLDLYRKRKK